MCKMCKFKKKSIIIDVDTGIDDSVALAIALASKKIDLKLVTTSAGNVGVEQSTQNTLDVLNYLKHGNVPVAKGEKGPLARNHKPISVHGKDGIGDFSSKFPEHNLKALAVPAFEAMADVINKSSSPITIVALGPLTNIAKLLLNHKYVVSKIEEVIIMAGSIDEHKQGEMPYPEFNVKVDPEACQAVISSGVKIIVCPMEMGHSAYLDYYDVYKTKKLNYAGAFFEKIFRLYKDHHVKNGIAMHDSCAVAYCIDPKLFLTEDFEAKVEYYNDQKIGILHCQKSDRQNVKVCMKCDIKKFKNLYFSALRKTRIITE